MPRLVDAAVALDIITSCRRVKAAEAQALGLIDEVVDELRSGAVAFATRRLGNKQRLRDLR